MSNIILDGKTCAQKLKNSLKNQLSLLHKAYPHLPAPGLAVIQVGSDSASTIYIKHKQAACESIGIRFYHYHFPKHINENDLLDFIDGLNQNRTIDAILCQLPLPKHLNVQKIMQKIVPDKDADGFHPLNLGLSFVSQSSVKACTPRGIWHLLKEYNLDLAGKHAVILNRSLIVGKPLAPILLAEDMTVSIAHSRSKGLKELCQKADLLVVAIGSPHFLPAEWVKEDAVLIDVGINRLADRLAGDIHPAAYKKARAYTPVPGGVGPMTVACLLANTIDLYCKQKKIDIHVALEGNLCQN